MSEQRIYVAVAGTVQVPADRPRRTVIQVPGRQIAQACHVVSRLRIRDKIWVKSAADESPLPNPITTIILQARDSAELRHVQTLLLKKKLNPTVFFDENPDVYGPGDIMTAVAVLATKEQLVGIMDYLPLWGAE